MEKKLRYSHQREMIYNYLKTSCEHPSADMVYEELRSKIPNLSLGTVYRNLKLLEELGKVKKVTTVNNFERYDAMVDEHVHFVCNECGKVIDMPILISDLKKTYNNTENEVEWASLILGGTCSSCKCKKCS